MQTFFQSKRIVAMGVATAIYTHENCRPAYDLNWSLSVFWKDQPPPPGEWLESLRQATEGDGVRVLEHHLQDRVSQFLVSTRPGTVPARIAQSVKGRLQYLVRAKLPKPFRRNYNLNSVGEVRCEVVESYVRAQLAHHRMADARVHDRLEALQISMPGVDLPATRTSGHAQFCYNLHIVLVNVDRGMEIRREVLERRRAMILGVAGKRGHLLSKAGILADHIHLTLGCRLPESPAAVALSYLNNLAYVEGMKPVYQFGFYAGTVGKYDLWAVRRRLQNG